MRPEMGPPETVIHEFSGNDDSWRLEHRAFVSDITSNQAPKPGLVEGINTLDIVKKIYNQNGCHHI
jgi:hypothetical protein